MPEPRKLVKAQLQEVDLTKDEPKPINSERTVEVQFNPETLTVTFTNQRAGGDQRGGSAIQFVGQGTTKLNLDLWFDVTVGQDGDKKVDDVRQLTKKVNYFITPIKQEKHKGKDAQWIAPGVRFVWGTFLFDGVMDSLTEKLEFFSDDGKPLRAQLTLALTSQRIEFEFNKQGAGEDATAGGLGTPGTQPRQQARSGDTIQSVAARTNQTNDWQKIASANNIENPRRLAPGTLLETSGSNH